MTEFRMVWSKLDALTVVAVEQLALAFRDTTYIPPNGFARDIFKDSSRYPTKALTSYLDRELGDWR